MFSVFFSQKKVTQRDRVTYDGLVGRPVETLDMHYVEILILRSRVCEAHPIRVALTLRFSQISVFVPIDSAVVPIGNKSLNPPQIDLPDRFASI